MQTAVPLQLRIAAVWRALPNSIELALPVASVGHEPAVLNRQSSALCDNSLIEHSRAAADLLVRDGFPEVPEL